MMRRNHFNTLSNGKASTMGTIHGSQKAHCSRTCLRWSLTITASSIVFSQPGRMMRASHITYKKEIRQMWVRSRGLKKSYQSRYLAHSLTRKRSNRKWRKSQSSKLKDTLPWHKYNLWYSTPSLRICVMSRAVIHSFRWRSATIAILPTIHIRRR